MEQKKGELGTRMKDESEEGVKKGVGMGEKGRGTKKGEK